MAIDSIPGGGYDVTQVDQAAIDLLTKFLTDTVGGSSTQTTVGGSTLVTGTGQNGETQGAWLPGASTLTGTVSNGSLHLNVSLPAGLGLVFAGLDHATPANVSTFLLSVIDQYLPAANADNAVLRASLQASVAQLVHSIEALHIANIEVRVVDFVHSSNPPLAAPTLDHLAAPGHDFLFDATGSADNVLFAFNLATMNAGDRLVLTGVQNALVSGPGSVQVSDNIGTRITSDNFDQLIVGGGGNDTLIGGGGHDTLTGGAGDDVFAFSQHGNFVITDFTPGHDTFAFEIPGITNVQQLLHAVTGATQTSAGITYEFGGDFSITLVGISAHDLTAAMVKFTL